MLTLGYKSSGIVKHMTAQGNRADKYHIIVVAVRITDWNEVQQNRTEMIVCPVAERRLCLPYELNFFPPNRLFFNH